VSQLDGRQVGVVGVDGSALRAGQVVGDGPEDQGTQQVLREVRLLEQGLDDVLVRPVDDCRAGVGADSGVDVSSRRCVVFGVPLAGGLAGGAEHAGDRGPGHPGVAGGGDGLGNSALGIATACDCLTYGAQRCRGANVVRLVVLEPASELVGVGEDFLQAPGHRHLLTYFFRAFIACTMTGP